MKYSQFVYFRFLRHIQSAALSWKFPNVTQRLTAGRTLRLVLVNLHLHSIWSNPQSGPVFLQRHLLLTLPCLIRCVLWMDNSVRHVSLCSALDTYNILWSDDAIHNGTEERRDDSKADEDYGRHKLKEKKREKCKGKKKSLYFRCPEAALFSLSRTLHYMPLKSEFDDKLHIVYLCSCSSWLVICSIRLQDDKENVRLQVVPTLKRFVSDLQAKKRRTEQKDSLL